MWKVKKNFQFKPDMFPIYSYRIICIPRIEILLKLIKLLPQENATIEFIGKCRPDYVYEILIG